MSEYITKARKLRPIIVQASASLDDASASSAAELFPALKQDGSLVSAGTRINWGGTIKRASVDLWDRVDNDPDHNPGLWEDIAYKDGYRVLTDAISASNPVQVDEICWYNGVKYKNILGTVNVYLPDVYPDGWEVVT